MKVAWAGAVKIKFQQRSTVTLRQYTFSLTQFPTWNTKIIKSQLILYFIVKNLYINLLSGTEHSRNIYSYKYMNTLCFSWKGIKGHYNWLTTNFNITDKTYYKIYVKSQSVANRKKNPMIITDHNQQNNWKCEITWSHCTIWSYRVPKAFLNKNVFKPYQKVNNERCSQYKGREFHSTCTTTNKALFLAIIPLISLNSGTTKRVLSCDWRHIYFNCPFFTSDSPC